jgi:hypothetical protein
MTTKTESAETCLPEREAAAYLNKSLATLRRWRWQRIGPPWIKNGAAVEYLKADLDSYRLKNRVVPRAA